MKICVSGLTKVLQVVIVNLRDIKRKRIKRFVEFVGTEISEDEIKEFLTEVALTSF